MTVQLYTVEFTLTHKLGFGKDRVPATGNRITRWDEEAVARLSALVSYTFFTFPYVPADGELWSCNTPTFLQMELAAKGARCESRTCAEVRLRTNNQTPGRSVSLCLPSASSGFD